MGVALFIISEGLFFWVFLAFSIALCVYLIGSPSSPGSLTKRQEAITRPVLPYLALIIS